MLLELERSTYLGPAQVLQRNDRGVQLELPDELAWATVALAFPYQPAVGDKVLAIGRAGTWYVIGVIEGSGTTTLMVRGDLKLLAPHGKIELMAGAGVTIHSSIVRILADRIEVLARTIFEKFTSASRWVKELFHLRAGHARTIVSSTYRVKAKRIVERAEDDVHIDGRKIHLG
jgi:hypothetical protein